MSRDFVYNLRTLAGLLLIAAGVAGGLRLAWWLSYEGDIIDLIHTAKMELPGWMWTVMKFVLSGAVGIVFLSFFIVLAVIVFSGGKRK